MPLLSQEAVFLLVKQEIPSYLSKYAIIVYFHNGGVYLTTKRITCTFFNISEPEKGKINALFENQLALIKSGKVHNVEVGGEHFRITFLRKNKISQQHFWVGIIEKLDTTLQGEASNLDGKRITYATGVDEGPIVNTSFIYYPLTSTFVLHRKIGGVNDYKLGVFIRKILKQTNIVSGSANKYVLSILPDLTKLDRFSKSPKIKHLEYTFQMPANIDIMKVKKRSILGDMLLANALGGDNMKVRIKAESLDVPKVIQKVNELMNLGGDSLSTLKGVTEHNGIEEPLDLLTQKFSDYEDVKLQKGQKETVDVLMDATTKIFIRQAPLLKRMYVTDSKDE